MLSHWMRQVRHAHASNPDTLKKIGETKDKEKEGKKEKEKHQESKYTERSTNDKGRPKNGKEQKKTSLRQMDAQRGRAPPEMLPAKQEITEQTNKQKAPPRTGSLPTKASKTHIS